MSMTDQVSKKPTCLHDLLADAPSNWERWGDNDEVGALNFLTPTEVLRGVQSVKQGKVITIGMAIGNKGGDPVWPGRTSAQRTMIIDKSHYVAGKRRAFPGGLEYADDMVVMSLQGSTQYDALGHTWYDDKIWNGYDAMTTTGGMEKASVFPIAQRGVVGRGVLLDVARARGVDALRKGDEIHLSELLDVAKKQGVTIEKHDILLIRTGFLNTFFTEGRAKFYEGTFLEPGLAYSKELVQWFYEMEIPALCTDTIANEATIHKETGIALPLHGALMRNLGVALNEICNLEELGRSCAEDKQYTFLYTAAPIKFKNATGAPVNPVVIK
jgi:kynurenine formamidase